MWQISHSVTVCPGITGGDRAGGVRPAVPPMSEGYCAAGRLSPRLRHRWETQPPPLAQQKALTLNCECFSAMRSFVFQHNTELSRLICLKYLVNEKYAPEVQFTCIAILSHVTSCNIACIKILAEGFCFSALREVLRFELNYTSYTRESGCLSQ